MSRTSWLLALLALAAGCSQPYEPVPRGTEGGQWRSYSADPASTKYAPLSQIDASNFAKLEIAWTWESTAIAWKRDVVLLSAEHAALCQALSGFPAARLSARPPRLKWRYEQYIYGAASHDLYHAGQIQLIKRLRRAK